MAGSDKKPENTNIGIDEEARPDAVEAPEDPSSPTDEIEEERPSHTDKRGKGKAASKASAKRSAEREVRRPGDHGSALEEKAVPSLPLGPVAHLAFVIVAALAVYSFVSVAKEGEMRRRCVPTCILRPTYAGYEKKAPSFTLKDTRGHDVSLDSYRGKVVVLNFWTKTCGPCMEEMPEIAELARILKPMDDVEVVTISTDETAQEAIGVLKTVLKGEPPFPVLMDPELTVVRDKFGTSLYPETWIIDKRGVIRARFDGAREWSNATVVEFINQIREGGYCPAQAHEGKFVGESAGLCEGLAGG